MASVLVYFLVLTTQSTTPSVMNGHAPLLLEEQKLLLPPPMSAVPDAARSESGPASERDATRIKAFIVSRRPRAKQPSPNGEDGASGLDGFIQASAADAATAETMPIEAAA